MSLTIPVPDAVPSEAQSSVPCGPSSAKKKDLLPAVVNPEGLLPCPKVFRSLTIVPLKSAAEAPAQDAPTVIAATATTPEVRLTARVEFGLRPLLSFLAFALRSRLLIMPPSLHARKFPNIWTCTSTRPPKAICESGCCQIAGR